MVRLDFADALPDESDDTRLKRNNRFLRSLWKAAMLIAGSVPGCDAEIPLQNPIHHSQQI